MSLQFEISTMKEKNRVLGKHSVGHELMSLKKLLNDTSAMHVPCEKGTTHTPGLNYKNNDILLVP